MPHHLPVVSILFTDPENPVNFMSVLSSSSSAAAASASSSGRSARAEAGRLLRAISAAHKSSSISTEIKNRLKKKLYIGDFTSVIHCMNQLDGPRRGTTSASQQQFELCMTVACQPMSCLRGTIVIF